MDMKSTVLSNVEKILSPIEIKSGKTINTDFFEGLKYWNKLSKNIPENTFIIYAGNENQKRSLGNVLSWKNLDQF